MKGPSSSVLLWLIVWSWCNNNVVCFQPLVVGVSSSSNDFGVGSLVSFPAAVVNSYHRKLLTSLDSSSSDNNNNNNNNLEEESSGGRQRRSSLDQEFPTGKALERLRTRLEATRESLQWAKGWNDWEVVSRLERKIEFLESRDPELVYEKAHFFLERIQELEMMSVNTDQNKKRSELVSFWVEMAKKARAALPRFQMEGLWIGKYGEFGEQLINITYSGDLLTATKVTGDDRVPRRETSFQVNLAPIPRSSPEYLPPIRVGYSPAGETPSSGSSSGNQKSNWNIYRFAGEGQIAEPNFVKPCFVPGQMVMFGSYFSFIWLPTKHNVFFVRPTPEDTLRLMRDDLSKEDELENQRTHLERCFAMDMQTCMAQKPICELEGPKDTKYSLAPVPISDENEKEDLSEEERNQKNNDIRSSRETFRRIMTHKDLDAHQSNNNNKSPSNLDMFRLSRLVLAAIPNKWKRYVGRFLGTTEDKTTTSGGTEEGFL